MDRKSFFWGVATGVVVTIAVFFIIGLISNSSDPVKYLENPVSYEGKKETSFKVLQVMGNSALAIEESEGLEDLLYEQAIDAGSYYDFDEDGNIAKKDKNVTSDDNLNQYGKSAKKAGSGTYNGNTVVILGENFYSEQIVTVVNPVRVGTYSYTNRAGIPMTVPVIDGEMR